MKTLYCALLCSTLAAATVACDHQAPSTRETPQACGNQKLDPGEICDDQNLNGQDCASIGQGFTGGSLGCNALCNGWDTTHCTDSCGNGQVDPGEVCDGEALAGHGCHTLGEGFNGGTLACNPTCTGWDTTQCSATCGDGQMDTGELCDGDDHAGVDCTDLDPGFSGGTLACNAYCNAWDTQRCQVDLRNFGGDLLCPSTDAVVPPPGTESYWVAARLTPPAYPLLVDRIWYTLLHGNLHGVRCNAGRAHRVEVFVTSSTTLAASPVALESHSIPSVDLESSTSDVLVSATLRPPLLLSEGQHLVIAIQNSGTHPDVTCVQTCPGPVGADRSWWSNADARPFDWVTLQNLGINGHITATAFGTIRPALP